MSKAEQRAFDAYPVLMCYNNFQMVEEDVNKPLRKIYQEGYHQAEKDTDIEKVCEKLEKCMYDNLMFQGRLNRKEVIESFIEDFRKAMKGE